MNLPPGGSALRRINEYSKCWPAAVPISIISALGRLGQEDTREWVQGQPRLHNETLFLRKKLVSIHICVCAHACVHVFGIQPRMQRTK